MGDATDDSRPPAEYWNSYFATVIAGPSLQVGEGATVPVTYAQLHARQQFAAALMRLVPNLTHSLVTQEDLFLREESLKATAAAYEYANAQENERVGGSTLHGLLEASGQAYQDFEKHVDRWQQRFKLTDSWPGNAAMLTLTIVSGLTSQGIQASVPLMVMDSTAHVHHGREASLSGSFGSEEFRTGPRHGFANVPVFFDDLRWPTWIAGDTPVRDDGLFATFDPRTETIDSGVNRILPALEHRLRHVLTAIVAEDVMENETLVPSALRSTDPYEWLVRYQVLGESRNAIALDVGKDRTNVGRQINQTASLIGLTLRTAKGGRPRRKHALTRKPVR